MRSSTFTANLPRALGIARSLAVYHAIPFRQRRMRRLYATFVQAGDLVFDIGAHAGNRTRAAVSLGCRVVALEPQPDFAQLLRLLFGRSPGVDIVEAAVGARDGRATLAISERTPTVTTLSPSWRAARASEPDFEGVKWNRTAEVEVVTLDRLVERFGRPAFVKIDVEGSEAEVLAGATVAIPALSFEYLPRGLDRVEACIARLAELGDYRFDWSPGESYRLASGRWLTGSALLDALRGKEAQRGSGDVYAREEGSAKGKGQRAKGKGEVTGHRS